MEVETDSLRKTARLAGLLYLALGITGAYAIMYVPSQIIVRGDAAATANNLIANEFLFRSGIVSHLICETLFVFLSLVLYRLFKQVNEQQAKLMVTLVIVQIPIVFLIESFSITSLMILKGEVLKGFGLEQKQDFALLFLNVRRYGIVNLEILWGLWLIPFGQLVYKSGFIPRILGVLLVIGGMAYVADSLTFLLFPDYRSFVSQYALPVFSIAEISIILWLLIKGVKEQQLSEI